ncbi:hypothetical protein JAAARDRAFT_57970 [Jaapia argillacea MUCL 33604]|uniref:BTB domain-containing protein n=1 Tax=Jaapia argillacea MUCL 33604 TaxID=933084 RepID=A0A067Q419_9AGAM|nr:hypothetical protein JAAARDRAFT_57970 [Jaapia argillacea MUCL 33604]
MASPTASCSLSRDDGDHKFPYMSDGNVVLSAFTEDHNCCYFRVHKSLLSLQSSVFNDMFELPQDEEACYETYDGVPLVHLPDDAHNLASLLTALYHPSTLQYPRLNPNTPFEVQGTLKLANKYQFDELRKIIVRQLEADWPQTLADWDRLEKEVRFVHYEEHGKDSAGQVDGLYLDDRFPEPASAIRLAQECDVPNILPAAFYHLSRIDLDADWDRYRSEGDKIRKEEYHRALGYGCQTARWGLLKPEDLMKLCRVRDQVREQAYLSHTGAWDRLECCVEECWQARTKYAWEAKEEMFLSKDPLMDLRKYCREEVLVKLKLCRGCSQAVKDILTHRRSKVWERLQACLLS